MMVLESQWNDNISFDVYIMLISGHKCDRLIFLQVLWELGHIKKTLFLSWWSKVSSRVATENDAVTRVEGTHVKQQNQRLHHVQ